MAVGAQAERAKFALIMLNEGAWPVAEMRSALKVTGQGYCAWRGRPPGARGRRDAELPAKISEICAASRGVYGAPKVFAELRRAGVRTSRKRVARLMRENGRAGTTRGCARRPKGERKAAAPQASAAPDLVRRDFSADGPDRARFAGITCVRTHQGWPCPAVVMDIWPRMVVGWPMPDRMGAGLADDALKMLTSIYLSPISPTDRTRSRQRTCAVPASVTRRFRRPGPAPGPWCGRTSR